MKTTALITLLAIGSALTFSSVNASTPCTANDTYLNECGKCGGGKKKEEKKDTEAAFINCGEKDKGKGGKKKDTDAFVNECGGCGTKEKKDTEKKSS